MKTIYFAKYIICPYDGEWEQHFFSKLENAVDFCSKSDETYVENPLNEGRGWLIEQHKVDNPKARVVYFNSKGVEIKYTKPVVEEIEVPRIRTYR